MIITSKLDPIIYARGDIRGRQVIFYPYQALDSYTDFRVGVSFQIFTPIIREEAHTHRKNKRYRSEQVKDTKLGKNICESEILNLIRINSIINLQIDSMHILKQALTFQLARVPNSQECYVCPLVDPGYIGCWGNCPHKIFFN